MAHGEAEHGCAQGEPCRPGHHEQQAAAKHRRLPGGLPAHSPEHPTRAPERPEDDVTVPRQRVAEPAPAGEAELAALPGCRSDLPGWAGAHRHGPVRPRQRVTRRERPPRRWC
ncbi:hypothetical protein ACLQ20_16490 [Micromonospora sp. DT46]|uniref:hypothetical protein n=1 Tax=unclassified Micromonospora TaxID=2617518 RepID=UPI00124AFF44|nr:MULTISPECIES: hypothetical protein [unclassified Micromonospora]KAB1138962.1 hypothetical protein F6X68_24770 [Micromonospora sp. AMSO12t]WSG01968.1 hypothetical protein OG989_30770 [Micromonospora sp. NBC_01740]